MTDAKQKFVDYREGSFVDFEGKDHYFIVCAVLKERTVAETLTRTLSFGVSFCNPVDKHNNELGKKIAYGKSVNNKNTNVILGRAGLLNMETVKYILDNEVTHVRQYPEQYSVSYAKAKDKYEEAIALAQKTAVCGKVTAD